MLALSLITILAVACATGSSVLDKLEAAGEKTGTAETARIYMSGHAEGDSEAAEQFDGFSAEGIIDSGSDSFQIDMSFPGMAGDGFSGDISLIIVGETYYLSVAEPRLLPPGKKWVEMDKTTAEQLGPGISGFQQMGNLTQSAGFVEDAEEVGNERVRGTETTRYRSTFNIAEALEDAEGDERERLEAMRSQVGSDSVIMDFWLDDEGFIRRMAFPVEMPRVGSVDFTMEFDDFGADLQVEAPPAGEVVEASEIGL
jgi:hypothetical protein